MKIEGVPDGWEPYAIGPVHNGETYMSHHALAVFTWKGSESEELYLKVRRIEPHCTWPHGQFKDGWVAQDCAGMFWFKYCPEFGGYWVVKGCQPFSITFLNNQPVFRSSLPWNERIQQVGPTFEATLGGET